MSSWTLGIDLAERYSGAVLLDPNLEVAAQWTGDFGARTLPDGSQIHHSLLVQRCLDWYLGIADDTNKIAWAHPEHGMTTMRVGLEDIGSGVMNPKPAMTLRGALLGAIEIRRRGGAKINGLPLIVSSNVWQKWIGYKKAGPGKDSPARKAYYIAWAAEHGLDPSKAFEKPTAKQREDLSAAYCIARYAADNASG